MQDEIMLAKSCLLENQFSGSGNDENSKSSMSSVIRLLDQTYQRLLCDENNSDKQSNATHSNNISRSNSKDKNIVAKEVLNINNCEKSASKEEHNVKHPQPVLSIPNDTKQSNEVLHSFNPANDITGHQNETSSTSSSSITSSSLTTSNTSSNIKKKQIVSNKKVVNPFLLFLTLKYDKI